MRILQRLARPLLLWASPILLFGAINRLDGQTPERQLLRPAPNDDGILKVLLFADMEGISGSSSVRSFFFPHEDYLQAQRALTEDLNAVIEGLIEGGCDSIHVIDAHGSRNPDGNILGDLLDTRAEWLAWEDSFGRFPFLGMADEETYDAMCKLVELDKGWVPVDEGASLYIRPTMIGIDPVIRLKASDEYLFYIICSPVGLYYKNGMEPTKIIVEEEYVRAVRGGVGFAKTADSRELIQAN